MATETTKITYVEGAAASTPAASRTVIYAKADGLMYSKDDAGTETLMSSGGAGAPTNADYLVGTANGSLSAEIVVGTSPGGELGGTWASPTVDATHSGTPHLRELNQVTFTSPVAVTGTTEGGAQTVVVSGSIAFDGSTLAKVEFYTPYVLTATTAGAFVVLDLYMDATIQGRIGIVMTPASAAMRVPAYLIAPDITPSNASHTFTIKAWRGTGDGEIGAGAGGTGAYLAGYIRVSRA